MTHLVPYLHNFKNQKSHFSTMRSASEASYVKIQNIFAPRIFKFFCQKKIETFQTISVSEQRLQKFENLRILKI